MTPKFIQRIALRCLLGWAVLAEAGAAAADTSAFQARIHTNAAGGILPYRLLGPKLPGSNTVYPVLLFLHGAAARGTDNAAPLDWGPLLIADGPTRAGHDFFLVIPQCPRGVGWSQATASGGSPPAQEPLRMAVELVTQVLPREFPIDPKRRYLTGVSMGGHAVWVALGRHPGVFAAAVPVCAPAAPASVTPEAVACPVWVFHSDDDHLVPVQQARDMVKSWRGAGGTARYTEYQGHRHSSWKPAYVDRALFDWLFAQRLR